MNYTVRQGDWLQGIAERFGFADYRTIYDHPNNAGFRQLRPDPDVIFPGDELFIPDQEPTGFDRPTGARHTFRVTRLASRVRLVLEGQGTYTYRLEIGAEIHEGESTGSVIEHDVAHALGEATLFAWPTTTPAGDRTDENAHVFRLHLGHLDPVEEESGVEARLRNLGFDADARSENVRRFQLEYGLDESGELDDATRSRLREEHDLP